MGRNPDSELKANLLQAVLQYLLEHSIQGLSLRPLAKAIGTNARMLIYHFGSKEQMIVQALELAQQLQLEALQKSPRPEANSKAELLYLWTWFSSDEFLAFGKLLFEVEVLSINGDPHYQAFATNILEGWVSFIESRFEACDSTTANVIVNTFSGLLLDLLVTKDTERINASFHAFATLITKDNLL